jgi:multidrug efflux system outer membrane protein
MSAIIPKHPVPQKKEHNMLKHSISIAAGFFLITGCTLTPKYERPAAPVAASWPLTATNAPASGLAASPAAADIGIERFFADERLRRIIALTLANNRDLRIAALNVDQARAQYRIQRSDLLPTLNATAAAARQRTPGTVSLSGQPVTSSQYSVSAGVAAYELDLFGRVRSLKGKALESYLASEEARRSVQIALVSEVAGQYLTHCALSGQLEVARATRDAAAKSYQLNLSRYQSGVTTELDLRSSEAQEQSARANVAVYERQLAQAANALVFVAGQPLPGDLPPARSLENQEFLTDLAAGLPSDLLQRRPDILAAEHRLKAANASIGAARAAFFPKILLTGAVGTTSADLSDLFTGPSRAWNFSPQITVPVFEAGRNKASLDAAKIGRSIEVAQYEKSIQTAFREVADALAARAWLGEQIQAGEALVKAQQQRFALAEARYQKGVDSYLPVLTAHQDLYSARQSLIQARLARVTNLVVLYQALGGGWEYPASNKE